MIQEIIPSASQELSGSQILSDMGALAEARTVITLLTESDELCSILHLCWICLGNNAGRRRPPSTFTASVRDEASGKTPSLQQELLEGELQAARFENAQLREELERVITEGLVELPH